MLAFLPSPIKGTLAAILVILNTMFWFMPVFIVAIFKLLVPHRGWRRQCLRFLTWMAEHWIAVNNGVTWLTQAIEWEVELPEDLDSGLAYGGSYLVISNHQSWADIVVLQRVFYKRIPFLKFFLKQQLIWVPLLGIAWWALDLPFMRRYSKTYLEKNPGMRGKDLEITRKACEKFRDMPVSIMNFVEGTRFRPEKHLAQQSPYTFLLKPKSGGVAFALNAMDGSIRELLDVTIVYEPHRAGFWQLLSGQVRRVRVVVKRRTVPEEFLHGDYQNDADWRERFQAWMTSLWEEKDREIAMLLEEGDTDVC